MRIAILETGLVPAPIRASFPNYPEMFRRLLSNTAHDLSFFDHNVVNAAPPALEDYDGFLITGSPAGVYEDHDWLPPLFDFIRAASDADKPQIGICFGHQAIAQALGGKVVKSDKGWGVGRNQYTLEMSMDWMASKQGDKFALAASHQDQVITIPDHAQVLASSEFTPFAGLYYPQSPALSFQGHPEFEDDYSAALFEMRRGNPLPDQLVNQAVASLKQAASNQLVANWMVEFYQHHA